MHRQAVLISSDGAFAAFGLLGQAVSGQPTQHLAESLNLRRGIRREGRGCQAGLSYKQTGHYLTQENPTATLSDTGY
jgi:hypothetical protein